MLIRALLLLVEALLALCRILLLTLGKFLLTLGLKRLRLLTLLRLCGLLLVLRTLRLRRPILRSLTAKALL